MLNWLNLISLLAFISMISAAIWFRHKAATRSLPSSWLPSIVLTVVSVTAWVLTFQWRLDAITRVVGFPFTAAIFELHDGKWVDFVGTLTLPAMAANLVFWVLLLRVPLMWYRWSRSGSQQCDGANGALGAPRSSP